MTARLWDRHEHEVVRHPGVALEDHVGAGRTKPVAEDLSVVDENSSGADVRHDVREVVEPSVRRADPRILQWQVAGIEPDQLVQVSPIPTAG